MRIYIYRYLIYIYTYVHTYIVLHVCMCPQTINQSVSQPVMPSYMFACMKSFIGLFCCNNICLQNIAKQPNTKQDIPTFVCAHTFIAFITTYVHSHTQVRTGHRLAYVQTYIYIHMYIYLEDPGAECSAAAPGGVICRVEETRNAVDCVIPPTAM